MVHEGGVAWWEGEIVVNVCMRKMIKIQHNMRQMIYVHHINLLHEFQWVSSWYNTLPYTLYHTFKTNPWWNNKILKQIHDEYCAIYQVVDEYKKLNKIETNDFFFCMITISCSIILHNCYRFGFRDFHWHHLLIWPKGDRNASLHNTFMVRVYDLPSLWFTFIHFDFCETDPSRYD